MPKRPEYKVKGRYEKALEEPTDKVARPSGKDESLVVLDNPDDGDLYPPGEKKSPPAGRYPRPKS